MAEEAPEVNLWSLHPHNEHVPNEPILKQEGEVTFFSILDFTHGPIALNLWWQNATWQDRAVYKVA